MDSSNMIMCQVPHSHSWFGRDALSWSKRFCRTQSQLGETYRSTSNGAYGTLFGAWVYGGEFSVHGSN